MKRLADEVSVASRQQAAGFEQVSRAVVELEKSTQAIAGTAEEGAAASEELNAQSETVMGVVGQLEVLVGGLSATGSGAAKTARRQGALSQSNVVGLRPGGRAYTSVLQGEHAGRHEGTGTFGSM